MIYRIGHQAGKAGGKVQEMRAAGKSEFGLCGVVGGMMVIELLAGKMRLARDGIAAEGCSPIGAGSMGGEDYCGNLLWQSRVTLLPPEYTKRQ